jgi:hypothetical protein
MSKVKPFAVHVGKGVSTQPQPLHASPSPSPQPSGGGGGATGAGVTFAEVLRRAEGIGGQPRGKPRCCCLPMPHSFTSHDDAVRG